LKVRGGHGHVKGGEFMSEKIGYTLGSQKVTISGIHITKYFFSFDVVNKREWIFLDVGISSFFIIIIKLMLLKGGDC
jgi:hypothetical protein